MFENHRCSPVARDPLHRFLGAFIQPRKKSGDHTPLQFPPILFRFGVRCHG